MTSIYKNVCFSILLASSVGYRIIPHSSQLAVYIQARYSIFAQISLRKLYLYLLTPEAHLFLQILFSSKVTDYSAVRTQRTCTKALASHRPQRGRSPHAFIKGVALFEGCVRRLSFRLWRASPLRSRVGTLQRAANRSSD